MNCVSFLALDIIIQSQNTEKCKEHPGPAKKMPNVVAVKEIQEHAFSVHCPVIESQCQSGETF